MKLNLRKAIAGVVGIVLGVESAVGAELYTVTQRIGGGRVWTAWAVNDHGETVGAGVGTAYYATGTNVAEAVVGLSSVGESQLTGINNHHVMVGSSPTAVASVRHAFSFDRKTGQTRDLGSLLGANGYSAARGINDAGLIVGESDTTNGTHAVRFELDGRITDLNTLGGDSSSAADVNENGDIVGRSKDASGTWRAFAIRQNIMVDLETLGGAEAWASAINDKGQIVGAAMTADGKGEACLWEDGKVVGLGQLGGGSFSAARAINEQGVIVGNARDAATVYRAWVRYPNGEMHDLADVAKLPDEDSFFNAAAINNNGLIVAAVFHRRNRGGAEFPAFLRPGIFGSSFAAGQLNISIAAPPGLQAEVESTEDFKVWTSRLSTTIQSETIRHAEPVENGSRFFRVSLKPQ